MIGDTMKVWLREWLIGFILRWIVVGSHCGCCGKWVEHELAARYWRVTICDECVSANGMDDCAERIVEIVDESME